MNQIAASPALIWLKQGQKEPPDIQRLHAVILSTEALPYDRFRAYRAAPQQARGSLGRETVQRERARCP
jgi:hypothetical protein